MCVPYVLDWAPLKRESARKMRSRVGNRRKESSWWQTGWRLGPFRNVIKKRALPLTGRAALTLFLMDDNKLAERRPISSREHRQERKTRPASLSTPRGGTAAGFQRTNEQFSDPSILPPSLSPLACPLHEDCKLLPLRRRRRPSIAYRTAREKQASGGGGGNRQLSKTNLVCCRRRRVRTRHT